MSLKLLVKKFCKSGLEEVCKKEGWKIPSLDDIKRMEIPEGCSSFWVSDIPDDASSQYGYVYDVKSGKPFVCNALFKKDAVVVRLKKSCDCCLLKDSCDISKMRDTSSFSCSDFIRLK